MYSVYLDESGHETGDYVVVAGFVGSEDEWKSFEEEWGRELGISRSFHMRKLRWKQDSTRLRLERLGPIPEHNGLKKVIGAVKVSDYSDLTQNMVEAYIVQGYHLALYPIIIEVLNLVPPNEHIRWFFERQDDYELQTRRMFEVFPKSPERLRDVTFIDKDDTIRTQPADFLAYAMLQKLRDRQAKRARWCEPIFSTESYTGMIVRRDLVRSIVGSSLRAAAALTQFQTGSNPREQYATTFADKKEVHQAMERAAKKRRLDFE